MTSPIQNLFKLSKLQATTPSSGSTGEEVATVTFVKSSLGSLSGAKVCSTNTSLTSTDTGAAILVEGGVSVTLPPISTCEPGAAFWFIPSGNSSTTRNILPFGTERILLSGTTPIASLALRSRGFNIVINNGTDWQAVSSNLPFSRTSSYIVLPEGLILQWGYVAFSGGTGTWTFPIVFPSACIVVYSTFATSGGGSPGYWVGSDVATTSYANLTSGSASSIGAHLLAIGY